jgi:hypothetical protein
MHDAAFKREGMGYVYEPAGALRLRLDYIKRGTETHSGEVTVESTRPGMSGLLLQARYNLVSSTAQDNLVKALKRTVEGTEGRDLPWSTWVREFFAGCLQAERAGEPFRLTGPTAPRKPRLAPLVQRLLPNGQTVMLYGPGGVGKGWIAVGLAVCVSLGIAFAGHYETQPAPVLYLDWEDNYEVFCERVNIISAGLEVKPPLITYRECFGSLRDQVHQIARRVSQDRIGLLIVDSFEMAAAFAGDVSTWDDRARGVFESIRAIRGGQQRPLAALLVDHVSDLARQQTSGVAKPYGSVFKGNWARLGWEVRKQQDADALVSHLGLYPWKTNHTAAMNAIGFRIDWDDPFDPTFVTITRDDVGDHDELVRRLGQREQIRAALRHGEMKPKEIADHTEIRESSIRSTLSRDQKSDDPWFIQTTRGGYILRGQGPSVNGRYTEAGSETWEEPLEQIPFS